MSKRPRTLDSFFTPPSTKKAKPEIALETTLAQDDAPTREVSRHATYPFDVPMLASDVAETLNFIPATEGRVINDQPDLDLLYFQPYIPKDIHRNLFEFFRGELFFYRVLYTIKRGPTEMQIHTPRYTTVFGVDETAKFDDDGEVVDAISGKPLPQSTYKSPPRPIPDCLDRLRELTQNATGCKFNFVLVNYYCSGNDSISYHSDDERFLGPEPAIASFTLGAARDFLMKHKPTPSKHKCETKAMKLLLGSGDMVLMRGETQTNWLHSIPKRKSGDADKGRINITLRRAMIKGGTDNYYRYNVGDGPAYKWNANKREMVPLQKN